MATVTKTLWETYCYLVKPLADKHAAGMAALVEALKGLLDPEEDRGPGWEEQFPAGWFRDTAKEVIAAQSFYAERPWETDRGWKSPIGGPLNDLGAQRGRQLSNLRIRCKHPEHPMWVFHDEDEDRLLSPGNYVEWVPHPGSRLYKTGILEYTPEPGKTELGMTREQYDEGLQYLQERIDRAKTLRDEAKKVQDVTAQVLRNSPGTNSEAMELLIKNYRHQLTIDFGGPTTLTKWNGDPITVSSLTFLGKAYKGGYRGVKLDGKGREVRMSPSEIKSALIDRIMHTELRHKVTITMEDETWESIRPTYDSFRDF